MRIVETIFPVCPAPCFNAVLKIGFPPICPGLNTVTLANGAVVDLNLLGAIISDCCPGVAAPRRVIVPPFRRLIDP